jgi:signal transduction histidine kinase
VVDSALALALAGVGLWEVLAHPLADGVVEGPLVLNLFVIVATTLPLAVRRSRPTSVAFLIFGLIAIRALTADPLEIYAPTLAGLVAVYSVAVHARLAGALAGLGAAVVATEIAAVTGTGGDAAPDPWAAPVLLGAVWVLGFMAGSRHARARSLEREAKERDRRRAEETAAAVAQERQRIARELHDSVSHSLALIAMQAGGADAVLSKDPERAAQSLRSIERAARDGLTEMRRLLGLMSEGDGDATHAPQPGIDRVVDLLEGAREAGLVVSLTSSGERADVSPAVEVSVYRIVQESLTNAARHAGRCQADVALRWSPSMLEVEVVSNGATRAEDSGHVGRGLIGMRERATLLGGELEVGCQESGRYRVRARLPLESPS